jgi:hypothetical protein
MGLANQALTPGRTSLLEAVNICLAVIGEAPVNTLETQQVGEAAQAERTLLEYHKEGQTRGWSWNREWGVAFYRDANSGEVLIPPSVVKWAPSRLEWNNRFQARGSRVYDSEARTYAIPEDVASIAADIVSLLPWDDCPEVFNRWANIRAARVFSNRAVGNTTTYQLTQEDENQAWADLLRVDTEQGQPNAVTGEETWATFRPFMGLGRRAGGGYTIWGAAAHRGRSPAINYPPSTPDAMGNGSVTSVGLSAPLGFAVINSPVITAGSLVLNFAPGYSLPTIAKQGLWDTAYSLASTAVQPAVTDALAAQIRDSGNGSVTSVGLSAPLGFSIANSPVTTAGSLVLNFAPGYSLPTIAKQGLWDTAVSLASTAVQPAVTTALAARLDGFRDANRVYVSPGGNDANNGTSPGEPLKTLAATAAAAQPGDLVVIGPGTYTEAALPIRWKRNVGLLCSGLRNTTVRPAAGQEMKDIFKVDSGFWCWGLEFAGHQANSLTGDLSWAISFDEMADNQGIGAVGLGAYILKSPYIQNCSSITAEDDSGTAGSVSTGDTGGGILVDGSSCAINSPIRSMVVDSYTQVNLGGPGCLVQKDGYAQLVSFFGTFCEYHVKTLAGGQVNLSGGGTSDFGIYGLVASGYSPTPVFTGVARALAFGSARVEKVVTIDPATDTFSTAAHTLAANDQVVFTVSQGALPAPLVAGTTYYVRSGGLTSGAFTVSATSGGVILDITGTATGTYAVVRQGVTQADVISFTGNRLGRQIKYPSAGSLGAAGSPVTISAVTGKTLTVTLGTSTIKHEYVGGGTLTVGGNNYSVATATYNNTTGATTITATGYTPTVGASITFSGLSFICSSSSRPSSGQLLFPQLVFPRNSTTGAAEAKTFTYTKTGFSTLTYTEAASVNGPDHEYVSGGTVVIGGTNYGVTAATYNKASGMVTITTAIALPAASSGSVTVNGLAFICPTSGYEVTSSVPIDASGNTVANDSASRAGYRVFFTSRTNGGLRDTLAAGQVVDFRQRSQITAPGHTFEYVGAGTNYDALPWNGGVPVPANKIVESNNGRIYSSNTDELGNFAVGSQFTVDGTSGAVTINSSQFNISGLNFIGPFSRNGGISTVGEQLREVSNNASLIASTGAPDGNTAPTQFAVKSYASSQFLQAVTTTAGQPISVSDTSTVDAQGFAIKSRNVTLSLNVAYGLVQLDGNGLVPAARLPNDFLPRTFTASAITYAASVPLDMAALAGSYCTLSLTGALTFTTSNRASGRTVTLRLICDSTARALTFPPGWVFLGAKPSLIAASKTAVLSLTFFGTTDADCVAAYGVQL